MLPGGLVIVHEAVSKRSCSGRPFVGSDWLEWRRGAKEGALSPGLEELGGLSQFGQLRLAD